MRIPAFPILAAALLECAAVPRLLLDVKVEAARVSAELAAASRADLTATRLERELLRSAPTVRVAVAPARED